MQSFDKIFSRAAKRKGGHAALEEMLYSPKSARSLARIGDDRYLAMMAKRIYQSGFVWRVVENKWTGIESAFAGFEPKKVARFSEAKIQKLLQDDRIIKHPGKTLAIRANANMVLETAAEHGSFAKLVSLWPENDITGLWAYLKQHGSRLGGMTGPYMLRAMGKDTFLLSIDVCKVLIGNGIVDKNPTSKKEIRATQDAFNSWREESGRSLCEISQVLAMSVD